MESRLLPSPAPDGRAPAGFDELLSTSGPSLSGRLQCLLPLTWYLQRRDKPRCLIGGSSGDCGGLGAVNGGEQKFAQFPAQSLRDTFVLQMLQGEGDVFSGEVHREVLGTAGDQERTDALGAVRAQLGGTDELGDALPRRASGRVGEQYGPFALAQVTPPGFAGPALLSEDAQDVIDDLVGDARVTAEGLQRGAYRLWVPERVLHRPAAELRMSTEVLCRTV